MLVVLLFLLVSVLLNVFLLVHFSRVKKKLHNSKVGQQHLQALVDSIPDLTWVKDKKSRFLMVNRQFRKAFGASLEEIIGKSDMELSPSKQAESYIRDDQWVMKNKKLLHKEERITGDGGTDSWAETVKVPILDDSGAVIGVAGMARDISERKKAEKRMRYLAYHDVLTGLPNRLSLESRINRYMSSSTGIEKFTLVFLDLDNFKIINDTIGHQTGDDILKHVAKILSSLVEKEDFVARIGGDEFICIFTHSCDATIKSTIENLRKKLCEPFIISGMTYELTVSIGAARYPENGVNCWGLVANADLAMYHAKQAGKNAIAYYSQDLGDASISKMTLESRLKKAIDDGDLEVFYQPKTCLRNRTISGFEALLRWKNRATGEYINPSDFIPVAEKSNLIVALGDWVFDRVATQINEWSKVRDWHYPIAVNISAVQVHQRNFVASLEALLKRHELPGELLELELTEGVIMENSNSVLKNLELVRDMGLSISIDDFGTGYSNLSYLSRFPLSSLKIDRSLIKDIHLRDDNKQITRAIFELAKSFSLSTIAEGVELSEELNVLKQMGIGQVQGYYYSRPLSPSKILDYVESIEKNMAQ